MAYLYLMAPTLISKVTLCQKVAAVFKNIGGTFTMENLAEHSSDQVTDKANQNN